MDESRLAVIDCGSNSFRLVVFTYTADWWKRTDEIHESVRVGEGLDATGELQPEPMARALETLDLYAHFCKATGIDAIRPVATSAIRDARNQKEFLKAARKRSGLEIEVLSGEEEAHYSYLAAVNSTTLSQGVVLDLGGGSMQLTRVEGRQAVDARSWPLGAVRMTERFLPEGDKPKRKQLKALREHVAAEIEGAAWLEEGGRLTGVGGTVRNLAAAAQLAAGLPSYGIQGFRVTRDALGELIEKFASMTADERATVPGIKFERGDLILAGAVVIDTVMEVGGFGMIEAIDAGLREGVFFESLLGHPPLVDDVRRTTVYNLAAQYDTDFAHAEHVARLSLELWDGLAAAGVHRGDPKERELLWATGDAARHRHRDRLRRPSQALALSDPERRHARLQPARDGPDRPGRALPPQGQPRPRRVHRARARRRRGDAQPPRGRRPDRRAARTLTRPGRQRLRRPRRQRPRPFAPARERGRHGRALGDRASGRRLPQGVRPQPKRHLNGDCPRLSTASPRSERR